MSNQVVHRHQVMRGIAINLKYNQHTFLVPLFILRVKISACVSAKKKANANPLGNIGLKFTSAEFGTVVGTGWEKLRQQI